MLASNPRSRAKAGKGEPGIRVALHRDLLACAEVSGWTRLAGACPVEGPMLRLTARATTRMVSSPLYLSGSRLSADGLQQSAQGLADHPRQIGVGGDRFRVQFAAQEI